MITRISSRDARYPIGSGHGSDAIHKDPVYSYAVTLLHDDSGQTGCGLAFTLGEGNDLVCRAAEFYAARLVGRDIEEIMADFGALQRAMADEQQFRWLGPHKGVVQLALASVTNACWDLWAKKRGVPLWKLLLDLTPAQVEAGNAAFSPRVEDYERAHRIMGRWAGQADNRDRPLAGRRRDGGNGVLAQHVRRWRARDG